MFVCKKSLKVANTNDCDDIQCAVVQTVHQLKHGAFQKILVYVFVVEDVTIVSLA